jgi:2'-5' RNA ligase
MRLFAAIPLPPEAQAEFTGILRELRQLGWPVRWVSEGIPHITLKFYGEVLPARLDVVTEAVQQAARDARGMAMRFTEIGVFPDARRPRVIWLGLDAPPALELLKDRVERASVGIGFEPEGVPFRAHVTLGRVRDGQRLPPGAPARCGVVPPGRSFVARQVVLYESELTPAGPRYLPRLTVELAG